MPIETLTQVVDVGTVHGKDFLLGFFVALALKRGRIKHLLDTILPTKDE
jgi:hypothetical protein